MRAFGKLMMFASLLIFLGAVGQVKMANQQSTGVDADWAKNRIVNTGVGCGVWFLVGLGIYFAGWKGKTRP